MRTYLGDRMEEKATPSLNLKIMKSDSSSRACLSGMNGSTRESVPKGGPLGTKLS
jgi:hypothetical protein